MEPIVAVIRIDEFVLGANSAPKTWPRGTLLKIYPRLNESGNPILTAMGTPEIAGMPVCCDEITVGTPSTTYTLTTNPSSAKPIGRFVHPPNTRDVTRGSENVIYFTPPKGVPKQSRYLILAEAITVGGPGDTARKIKVTRSVELYSCGPKYVSAAIGGVVDLDWDFASYPQTLLVDKSLDDAYAGSPVYIKETGP